jgi:hypothetical protein
MADSASSTTPAPRICPTCGEVIGQRDKFCPMCGANLAGAVNWVAPVAESGDGASASTEASEEIVPLAGLGREPDGPPATQNEKKALVVQASPLSYPARPASSAGYHSKCVGLANTRRPR